VRLHPEQEPHGPGLAPALGLRAEGDGRVIVAQIAWRKEQPLMAAAMEIHTAPKSSEASANGQAIATPPAYREVRYEHSRNLPAVLQHLGASLLVSTYQAGKLFVVGARQGSLALSFHNFEQAMGIAVCRDRIAVGTRNQVWFLGSAPEIAARLEPAGQYDGCFLARRSHFTGDIHGHELAWSGNDLWVVNTSFSCLCTLHENYSFVPRWQPPFISALAPEDRCRARTSRCSWPKWRRGLFRKDKRKSASASPAPARPRPGARTARRGVMASPRRSVCASGAMALSLYRRPHRRTEFIPFYKETLAMWFTSRLHRRKTGQKLRREGRFVPRLEILEARTLLSTLTVTNDLDSGPGSLRASITNAKSGDTIVFAPSLNGQTITLTSDEITIHNSVDIEGPGASLLAIGGNNANRIFNINGGYSVTINGLTLNQGQGKGDRRGANSGAAGGGAILNGGSTVSLANDVFSNNQSPNIGGAITNGPASVMTVSNCSFLNNQAVGQVGAHFIEGGAIWNSDNAFNSQIGASLTVIGCTFVGNQAIGANGGQHDNGSPFLSQVDGGAIHTEGNDLLTVESSVFIGNQAIAGSGGSADNATRNFWLDTAIGGAITTDDSRLPLTIDSCTFLNNEAIGGSNASGISTSGLGTIGAGIGGAILVEGPVTITNCNFAGNQALGGNNNMGGSGGFNVGAGEGGAIASAPFQNQYMMTVSNSTFTNNVAEGGTGNVGGINTAVGLGGAFANVPTAAGGVSTAVITASTFTGNQAIGGQGGAGGNGSFGLGGAIANVLGMTMTVSHCTLTGNQAVGGAGGAGGNGGNGLGGGIFNDGTSILPSNFGTPSTVTVTVTTIMGNSATGSAAASGGSAGQGIGGGVYFLSGGVVCLDAFTVAHIFGNIASTTDNDIFGVFTFCP
jgi:hypothetical protein